MLESIKAHLAAVTVAPLQKVAVASRPTAGLPWFAVGNEGIQGISGKPAGPLVSSVRSSPRPKPVPHIQGCAP